jgi:signal transduction histidine kinase
MDLLRKLVLPAERTAFETAYLTRTNRLALAFGLANVPLIVLVAWANTTGPGLALVLTLGVLSGPALAVAALRDQRVVSVVHGVASMCIGGLLVHFGQGPMQIEMHFYFFSLLAMLAVFANPMVILAAAGTVTLHHTVVWALLPASVFNYDAGVEVVAVHAAFVVVESVVACGIARSFFDNVIGLEKLVQARTRALDARNVQMRRVLDTVAQGFVTVDPALRMHAERSRAVEELLGPTTCTSFLDYARSVDPDYAGWLDVGWEEVHEGFLPRELAIAQLPGELSAGDRLLSVDYTPVAGTEEMLIVLTDITAQRASEQADVAQRELLTAFQCFLEDKRGFLDFFVEADIIVRSLPGERDPVLLKRKLHTLKGNAGVFGFTSLGRLIHSIETDLEELGGIYAKRMQDRLEERWRWIRDSVEQIVEGRTTAVELSKQEYERLLSAVDHASRQELHRLVSRMRLEPADRLLQRLVGQGRSIASRLGKQVRFEVEANGVRLDRDRMGPFFSSFVHVLRNALDHGVETAAERVSVGKPEEAVVRISVTREEGGVVMTVRDDGAGVDWSRVADVAAARGLPHETLAELTAALLSDGLSTRPDVDEMSGRGVGLAAVHAAVEDLGGELTVESVTGEGTTIGFRFPEPAVDVVVAAAG